MNEYKERFEGDLYFYGNASHGLYDVLVWLQKHNTKATPNIVLPIFIPAKLFRLVLAAGYEPRFYDIRLDCSVDPRQIEEKTDQNTQAIMAIHYFGIPSPVNDLRDISNRKNIYLIEDCAHTINSQWENKELGTIGDCALFSSRKMLQLPAGGFLALNKQPWPFEPSYRKRVRSIYTACKGIRMRLKPIYSHLTKAQDPLRLARIPSTGYINFSEEHRFSIKKISWLNHFYIRNVDLDKVANTRRDNYEYVLNGITGHTSIHPVGGFTKNRFLVQTGQKLSLKEGITPYSFPILAPRGTRNSLRKILYENGIGCGAGWPEAPFGHKNFEHTLELSERLLELPIHQGMTRLQLNKIIETVREFKGQTSESQVKKADLQETRRSKLEVV
ncbi:MAG: DegT/DnrJ/EryC1/StrS family aminotransferase [Gracilimonas sp.]|uniref:DegT/DnrJ/EryC1/StrS family aminotransferase n=1 Tax=Gracilimonas sp. TaxID=1974203 RepID=UPI0019BF78DF|nr:DegT/DnrJ/EryC1/StrS family aminotransferase [Gracilimonas sp.]MBD3615433.1 DegT/DnrJ/EryC1/StrS family aminotransferase [Gracilimonas sp.]